MKDSLVTLTFSTPTNDNAHNVKRQSGCPHSSMPLQGQSCRKQTALSNQRRFRLQTVLAPAVHSQVQESERKESNLQCECLNTAPLTQRSNHRPAHAQLLP